MPYASATIEYYPQGEHPFYGSALEPLSYSRPLEPNPFSDVTPSVTTETLDFDGYLQPL